MGLIRVQQEFPWVLQGAKGVVGCPCFLLIMRFRFAVTAEVAGSSPVVPATINLSNTEVYGDSPSENPKDTGDPKGP